ncbi:Protein of unknown function [Quadrisphaera granulorum]|uniref:DUF3099 family protein n=2 Tax=Quadrisphaera granulorum TaxID=317664 RepID=A0A316A0D9_9ACTN|nr:Protein of unknown function (DUF3099) [Quadrisphaera granulorum]SZE97926.1 Protein of unknown function [Quadrisphaera granulorum]
MLRYGITMGIRVLCFGLIFVLDGPWRWVAAIGAIFLPYVAVLIANAGRERLPVNWGSGRSLRDVPSPHQDEQVTDPAALRPVQVVRGETVDHHPAADSSDDAGRASTPGKPQDDDGPPEARAS